MKIYSTLFLILCLLLFTQLIKKGEDNAPIKEEYKAEFKEILEKHKVKGSILFYEEASKTYFSNDFDWSKTPFIPASTYKIPHTLIALELGIVNDAQTILKWDGINRNVRVWNQDLTLKEAFHFSCVPCYQGIARQVGMDRMKDFLGKFKYGKVDFDSDEIDMFWLEGDTEISQFEQIDFLRRYEASELPISQRTERLAKELMLAEEGDDYKMLAKTGLSLSGVGWYVGYLKKGGKTYFFATNLEIGEGVDRRKRIEVTEEALKVMGVLPDKD